MHNQNWPSCALINLYAQDKTFEYPSMQHQNVTSAIVQKRGRVTFTVPNCKIRSKGLSFGISTITIMSLVEQYQSTKIRILSSNPTFKLKTTESMMSLVEQYQSTLLEKAEKMMVLSNQERSHNPHRL
jgi:hypothetical protein